MTKTLKCALQRHCEKTHFYQPSSGMVNRIGQYHRSLKTAPKIEVCIHLVTPKKVRKNTGKRMRIGLLGLLVLDSLMVNVSKQRFP